MCVCVRNLLLFFNFKDSKPNFYYKLSCGRIILNVLILEKNCWGSHSLSPLSSERCGLGKVAMGREPGCFHQHSTDDRTPGLCQELREVLSCSQNSQRGGWHPGSLQQTLPGSIGLLNLYSCMTLIRIK